MREDDELPCEKRSNGQMRRQVSKNANALNAFRESLFFIIIARACRAAARCPQFQNTKQIYSVYGV